MPTQENESVVNDENELLNQEIVEDEQAESVGELSPENEEEKESAEEGEAGGESEDAGAPDETAEEPPEAEILDDLEIPEPDLKKLTVEDYKAIRKEKQRKREEQRQEELREEAFRREQEILIQAKADQVALSVATNAPNRDDFEDDAAYYVALHKHATAKEEIRRNVISEEKAFMDARIKLSKDLNTTLQRGAERYSDFEEVTGYVFSPNSDVPANVPLAEGINESKDGPDILYMLAKNKKKMIEVASMHPRAALRWLWETEHKIEAIRKRKKEGTIAANIDKPKPMTKVASKMTPYKDIGSMTTAEYREYDKNKRRNG